MDTLRLRIPDEFDINLCFQFLRRSPKELLHRLEEDRVLKLLLVDGQQILFSVRQVKNTLNIDFLKGEPTRLGKETVRKYVHEWFDLETDLKPFYAMARRDLLLKDLVKKHRGYRIIGQPDLFESLVWAVLGQQINLSFAYSLKQRFVEQFGESLAHENQKHYLFPSAKNVSKIQPEQLLALQFSRQKALYTIGIAKAFAEGRISKVKLAGMALNEAKEELMKIKGIGNWTANYALMKTFRYPDAFPLEDAGLHNAIKNSMGLKAKPDVKRVKRIFQQYKGWEAYATLYLWKSLEDFTSSSKKGSRDKK